MLRIKPINDSRADFAGQVDGLDVRKPLSDKDRQSIENAMDVFGVLVFPKQVIDDEQQFAFSANFGKMEKATGDINAHAERCLLYTSPSPRDKRQSRMPSSA